MSQPIMLICLLPRSGCDRVPHCLHYCTQCLPHFILKLAMVFWYGSNPRNPQTWPNIQINISFNFEYIVDFYQSYTTDVSDCGSNRTADLVCSNIGRVIAVAVSDWETNFCDLSGGNLEEGGGREGEPCPDVNPGILSVKETAALGLSLVGSFICGAEE